MAINEIIQNLIDGDNKYTFEEATNKAYATLKEKTGFDGKRDNPKELSTFFSTYNVTPLIDNNQIMGIKIEYALNADMQKKINYKNNPQQDATKEKNSAAGCNQQTSYKF